MNSSICQYLVITEAQFFLARNKKILNLLSDSLIRTVFGYDNFVTCIPSSMSRPGLLTVGQKTVQDVPLDWGTVKNTRMSHFNLE